MLQKFKKYRKNEKKERRKYKKYYVIFYANIFQYKAQDVLKVEDYCMVLQEHKRRQELHFMRL